MNSISMKAITIATATASLLSAGVAAKAQVEQLADFQNQNFTQNGPSSIIEPANGFSFTSRLFTANSNDISTAVLTGPYAGSPQNMPSAGSNFIGYIYEYNTGQLTSQTDLTTANPNYPFGTYTASYSGGNAGSGSVAINYSQSAYTLDAPLFDATTYNSLQGLNPNQGITISWNADQPGTVANENDIFYDIIDSNGNVVFNQGFLGSSTQSVYVPAGTLQADTSYYSYLDFSNRINGNDPVSGIATFQGFDQTTQLGFTTSAAPEPSGMGLLILFGAALAGLLIKGRRSYSSSAN